MEEITIGYLSWKRYNIFEQTLNSHKNNGLFDLIHPENRIIFFQELSDIDIKIAKKYYCNFIGSNTNIGILSAFIQLIEKCKTEYFIFCENDWFLIENKDIVEKLLSDCIDLIKSNNIDIINISIEDNIFEIEINKILFKKYQTYIIQNKGISQVNINNIFDCNKKSNVIFHIKLS